MSTTQRPNDLKDRSIAPICESNGCMHEKHFKSIRRLQKKLEDLEKRLRSAGLL